MSSRPLLAVAAVVLAIPLAACGGGGSDKSGETAASSGSQAAASATPSASAAVDALARSISEDRTKKPQIGIPEGGTPKTFVKRDIVKGTGRAAKKGDTVEVQYVGSSWSTGSEFDASWDKGQPFSFPLGQGQVIPGWDQGVAGMKVGGRRLLIIPPDLGYGAQGSPPAIGPNETLAFVVDLEGVK
jgi:peptidylprolyl isomerase